MTTEKFLILQHIFEGSPIVLEIRLNDDRLSNDFKRHITFLNKLGRFALKIW